MADMDLTQFIKGKTWNAQPGLLGGKPATAFSPGWLNYYDSAGKWAPINCCLKALSGSFETAEGPFAFRAPRRSTGYAEFNVTNCFDVFKKSLITGKEFRNAIRCLGVEDVPGKLFDFKGNGRLDSVLYPGAYASTFAGDLIYHVQQGHAPRLRKLIRFQKTPSADVAIQFEFDYGGKTEISPRKLPGRKKRVEARDAWVTKLGNGKKLHLHSDREANDGLYVRQWDGEKRGAGLRQPYIWDSRLDPLTKFPDPKIQKIKAYLERIGKNRYKITKIIPKAFFNKAVFPVYTDLVSSFYPDPFPESKTTDGTVWAINRPTWTDAHEETDADSLSTDYIYPRSTSSRDYLLQIRRVLTSFDTSPIGSADEITDARLSYYLVAEEHDINDAQAWITIVQPRGNLLASDTSLSPTDFPHLAGDAITNPTELIAGGDRKRMENMTPWNQYFTFALSAGGIALAIARNGERKPAGATAGITFLAAREGHDVLNVPMSGYDKNNYIFCASSETAGQQPTLMVAFNPVSVGGYPLYSGLDGGVHHLGGGIGR